MKLFSLLGHESDRVETELFSIPAGTEVKIASSPRLDLIGMA